MALLGGGHAVLVTVEILVPVGLVALALAALADGGHLRLRTLRHRFGLGMGLALGQLLAAVAIGAAVMFVSPHDAWMTVAILLFAAVVATRAAQLLLSGVVRDVRAVREGLHALERGERDVQIEASSGRELEDLAHTANRMIAALAAEERARDTADAARRQVIAAVSHDLRTPLSTLRLLAQALEDELVDPTTARRYVHTIGANVRTLGTLIDDLFELSCLDAGDVAWSTEAVDLTQLVGETIELVGPTVEAAGVALSAELPADLAPADANADRLRRVLLNLLAERDPPHPARRQRRDPRDRGRRDGRGRGRGHRRRASPPRIARTSSSRSTAAAATPRARGRAAGWAWRSRARSSRPTADGSGWRRRRAGRACASRCRRRRGHSETPPRHDPARRLAGDRGDAIEVLVVVHQLDLGGLRGGGDQ